MSFVKRSDAAPICHSKLLDSVKNWNNHFFWVDSTAFPLSVSLKSKILKMDLFALIRHSDPTKVRTGNRDLAEREVKLLKMTEGRTVSLDPLITAASGGSGNSIDKLFDEGDDAGQEHSVEKDDDVLEETIALDVLDVAGEKAKNKRKRKVTGDASGSTHPPKKLRDDYQLVLLNTSRKSLSALRGLFPDGSGIPSGVTKPLIAASVAPTSDVGPTNSVSGLNLSIIVDAPVVMVVVTTTVVDVAAIPGSKLNNPSTSSDSFYGSQSLDTETMHRVYVPRWKVTNDSVLEEPYVYHDLIDRLAPPALFAQLRAIDYNQLYSEFNVGTAQQVCLGAEVRMQAKHTLENKGELEDKCAEQVTLLSERDAEIVHLKSLLSWKETEAAEAIRLRGQLTSVEATDAAKDSKLKDLKEKNFALEGEREMVAELYAQLLEMVAHLDKEFYPCFLTAISERRWILSHGLKLVILKCLKSPEYCHDLGTAIGCVVNKGIQDDLRAGVDHRIAGRDLSIIEAYDPSAEAKYVEAINALGAVDFSMLSELKSKKDASIVDLIDSLHLEGPLAEILRAEDLLIGEASTSATPVKTKPITTLSTTLASSDVIPFLATFNDQAFDTEANNEDPTVVIFEKKELVTSPE
ncbi:hypothetical protein Tco_1429411 [Tanacetum coccineum]